jgi:hypothetical protein
LTQSDAVGSSAWENIRTAKKAGITLSEQTERKIREPSRTVCVRCHRPYNPTSHRQRYCPDCQRERSVKSLPEYKRFKAKYHKRIESARKKKEYHLEKAEQYRRLEEEARETYRSKHLWQYFLATPPAAVAIERSKEKRRKQVRKKR